MSSYRLSYSIMASGLYRLACLSVLMMQLISVCDTMMLQSISSLSSRVVITFLRVVYAAMHRPFRALFGWGLPSPPPPPGTFPLWGFSLSIWGVRFPLGSCGGSRRLRGRAASPPRPSAPPFICCCWRLLLSVAVWPRCWVGLAPLI